MNASKVKTLLEFAVSFGDFSTTMPIKPSDVRDVCQWALIQHKHAEHWITEVEEVEKREREARRILDDIGAQIAEALGLPDCKPADAELPAFVRLLVKAVTE